MATRSRGLRQWNKQLQNPGHSPGFGVAAGPLRFGALMASSSNTPPSTQRVTAPRRRQSSSVPSTSLPPRRHLLAVTRASARGVVMMPLPLLSSLWLRALRRRSCPQLWCSLRIFRIKIHVKSVRENLAPSIVSTALVTISGVSLSADVVEAEVAKIASLQSSWKWEAVHHGANTFLVAFPFVEILQRVAAFEYNVKSHDVKIAFIEWKVEEISSLLPLQAVWVHVTGVPPPLRHFLGGCSLMGYFLKKDGSDEGSVSSDVYVKLNGYVFWFVLEEDDFVPDGASRQRS
ncbi:retrotransposon unclassified [Hordeum vulgare]|nr:retrotransposon unclassified [Hordeum vulgare]